MIMKDTSAEGDEFGKGQGFDKSSCLHTSQGRMGDESDVNSDGFDDLDKMFEGKLLFVYKFLIVFSSSY
jgi:hypothetical protein